MKRVLITGANSYVGTNVEKWLMREPDKYYVETLDMKNPNWKNFDFSNFDVVFHVAGIAHVSAKKSMKNLYFEVNRDLAIKTAIKSKESGVKQFIFMSSMIVYNSRETRINKNTKPKPDNFYGLSKLQAEENIILLQSDTFNVAILRPPMIYGPSSKGNFSKLQVLSRKIPIFPNICNKRSMLYIDNLSNSIKFIIDQEKQGLFFPQNLQYSCTSEIMKIFSMFYKRKVIFTPIFNLFIKFFRKFVTVLNKMFSDSFYDFNLSKDLNHCSIISLDESLEIMSKHG